MLNYENMSQASEILFVDDDRVIRKTYRAAFESDGFAVRDARNGEEGLAAFREKRPDVVVLDMMMPKMNGLETCRAIRQIDAHVPILFLSCLAEDTKKLRAYDSGADDYIEKTTNLEVVLAKLHAILRRMTAIQKETALNDRLRIGEVEVDLKGGDVIVDGKTDERLTRTEADILRILSAHRGESFTCDELIARLRGDGYACEDAMLYSHVSRLRKKLGPASEHLISLREIGYSLRADAVRRIPGRE